MLRVLSAALRGTARAVTTTSLKSAECKITSIFIKSKIHPIGFQSPARNFSVLCMTALERKTVPCNGYDTLFRPSASTNVPATPMTRVPVRTLIKFTRYKGKRKTARTVLKRFYRLNWGIWIRTKAGRFSHLWRKTIQRKRRLRRHVFVSAGQSRLLDTLVSKNWRKPKYYVDDPYNPYHKRESFFVTRTKPRLAP